MSLPDFSQVPAGEAIWHEFPARDFVRVRASLTEETAFIVWQGAIYSLVPGEKKQHLFDIVGMSAARCLAHPEGGWDFTSRELLFYLDPKSGELLHRWHNPWTDETVTVVHVANSPVQGRFRHDFPALVTPETTTFIFDLFPNYPNSLADDPKFQDYSPQALYQAVELFKLTVPTAEILNPDPPCIEKLLLAWSRIGPWLPWMKMGAWPGQMIYSASGRKVMQFDQLPRLIQEQIQTRLPLFTQAPPQKLDTEDMTSWRYFAQNFEAYLAGEQFPLPAPNDSN
ncbi:DUF1838 domain-containing protein [Synechococcus sp. PCC 6312]|uniref:DUF1838 domain-containing protein n=1 Tax=Synechococcus sp. (strain ATCC 27167 / PCC 6312) TaxID=195253 RepID=UPI00029EEA95|nr:DUF1838 domain-containing protein [Synechococcus sp. PCC 6312]AFY62202.1 Protein of unknown function (DUF1838) [Synechococcus sp. PCC 6312]